MTTGSEKNVADLFINLVHNKRALSSKRFYFGVSAYTKNVESRFSFNIIKLIKTCKELMTKNKS